MNGRPETIYDMFADAERAYETWKHESAMCCGYPDFWKWVYMTPNELWDAIDPISGYHVTCASCVRKECRHGRARATCPVPELYEPSQAVLESRRAKAAEYVRQMTRGRRAEESGRTPEDTRSSE